MLLELFVRYDLFFHQSIHSIFESGIYISISLLVVQVIFVHYLLWYEFDFYLLIFGLLCWVFQVEVIDIYYKIFSVWGGEDIVSMYFGHD